jgi:pyruvate dehydrogenase E2 component (dihydrolipoamide acetyltransferase)
MEVEAVDEGVIGKILIPGGTGDVAVNSTIALLLEDGEDKSALDEAPAPAAGAPAVKPDAPAAAPAPSPVPATNNGGDGEEKPERIFASPLARRIAADRGLDLGAIKGSGPGGRIVKADVENAQPAAGPVPAEQAALTLPPPGLAPSDIAALYAPGSFTEEPLNSMRATIARRLTEAKRDVPHYYLSIDCRLDALLAARKRLNARLEDVRISVNDFIIRAAALALMKVPDANAAFAGDRLLKFNTADISMAVAIDGGLITPIIRNAQSKSLSGIALEAKELAGKAREMKLMPEEYEGGSFTISNLGMMGIKHFTAVINPPQAAILAIGAGEKRAIIAEDGSITAATVMTVTLSCDHRVIDGALGARWLAEFKTFIEDPVMMLA